MQRRMGAADCYQFIMEYFRAHAIKGELKPNRTYEIIEETPSRLLLQTRNSTGTWRQTLEVTLRTCKSLRHGEFRRVDLFWKWRHQGNGEDRDGVITLENGARTVAERAAVRIVDRHADGTPLAVDEFLGRGFGVFSENQEESQ